MKMQLIIRFLMVVTIIAFVAASATINRSGMIDTTVEVTININPDNAGENDAVRVITLKFTLSNNIISCTAQTILHILKIVKSCIDLIGTNNQVQNGKSSNRKKKQNRS